MIANTQNNVHAEAVITAHRFTIALLLITAILGYVAGYGKLYAFHVSMVAYWIFIILGIIKIRRDSLNALLIPFALFVFMALSLLWAPNKINGLYFIFYFFCGLSLVIAIVNYANTLDKLNFIFKIMAVMFMTNFIFGALETTGYFRLPASPYYDQDHTRPSGFNGNLNNFGFVFMAVFPFLFLYPRRLVKLLSMFLITLFAVKLESKGFFLGAVSFFYLYFLLTNKSRSRIMYIFRLMPVVIVLSLGVLILKSIEVDNRAFSAFTEIDRGIEMIQANETDGGGSTFVRAQIYSFGIQELYRSYGLGIGIAGVGSLLAVETDFFGDGHRIYSFHNFFLEMLVDFGALPFFIFLSTYISLALSNIRKSKVIRNQRLAYYSKASGLSLLVMIPASIAPSSIIYVFTFWIVIGFAIAIYKINKRAVS